MGRIRYCFLLVRRWGMKRVLILFLLLLVPVIGLLILLSAAGGSNEVAEPLPTQVTERPPSSMPRIPAEVPSSGTRINGGDCETERRAAQRTIESAYDRARDELDEVLEDMLQSGEMASMSDAELDMVALAYNEAVANAAAIRDNALARLTPCP